MKESTTSRSREVNLVYLRRIAAIAGASALALVAGRALAANNHLPGDSGSKNRQPQLARSAHPIRVGFMDDRLKSSSLDAAKQMAAEMKAAGADYVKVTQNVTPGSIDIKNDMTGLCNAAKAAEANDLDLTVLMLQRYPDGMGWLPNRSSGRLQFATTEAATISRLKDCEPRLGRLTIAIGNEPNNKTFARDQARAPEDYTRLLAVASSVAESKAQEINLTAPEVPLELEVMGEELSSDDQPLGFISAQQPFVSELKMRDGLIDTVGFHAYPEDASHPLAPNFKRGFVGLSRYNELRLAVSQVFGANVGIVLSEQGVQTDTSSMGAPYTGREPANANVVSEAVQASSIETMLGEAVCLDKVKAFTLFPFRDDPERDSGWQSGLEYADGKPKTSMERIVAAIRRAKAGISSYC